MFFIGRTTANRKSHGKNEVIGIIQISCLIFIAKMFKLGLTKKLYRVLRKSKFDFIKLLKKPIKLGKVAKLLQNNNFIKKYLKILITLKNVYTAMYFYKMTSFISKMLILQVHKT